MSRPSVTPTSREVFFDRNDVIVSKTDLKGKIVYANDVFLEIAGYRESEVIGQPHNMIRHPEMPRSVFAMLWDRIKSGEEIFAFVKNMTKAGDHYWVLAHVTPSFDDRGEVAGFHSNRRVPERSAVEVIDRIYRDMADAERRAPGPREAIDAGRATLQAALAKAGRSYDQFVFTV